MDDVVGESSVDNFLTKESSGQMIKTEGSHTSILAPAHEIDLFSISASCAQTDRSVSPEPCIYHGSSPLSDSELPDTFDIPLNSANVPELATDLSKVNTEFVAHRKGNEVGSTSRENEAILGRHSNDLKLEKSMEEQFSQLGSTVTNILVCPSLIPSVESAHDSRRSLEVEQMHTNPETHKTELAHVQESRECNASSVTVIAKDLPLLVTTYADATNLAKKYPELAKEILKHPLPKPRQQQISSPKMDRPLSPSLHHPDRPHWAAAPLDTATFSNDDYVSYKPNKARRNRGTKSSSVNSSSRGARRDSSSPLDLRDRRHEPPSQKGNHKHDRPAGVPHTERLFALSKAWTNDFRDGSKDTSASTFRMQDSDYGPSAANYSATSLIISSGHSDVGARREISNKWVPAGANLCNDVPEDIPNATDVSADSNDTYQQAPSTSGSDRLGRHIILPHLIDPIPEQRRTSRRVHKQQVSEINTATLRYLGKESATSDRGNHTASSGSNWKQLAENSGEAFNKRFNGLSRSVPHNNIQPQRDPETSAGKASTPKSRSDAYSFRDIRIQMINNPQIAAPSCYSLDSKPDLSLASQSQENHTLNNASYGLASDWLPVQHTAEDWLPLRVPQNRARNQAPYLADASDACTSSKPVIDGNSYHVTRNASPSYLSGREFHPNRSTSTDWFSGAAAQDVSLESGPKPEDELLGYGHARRSRGSLPAQTEAFAQYLAERSYHSSRNTRGGRGWRADGRSATGSSTSYGQTRNPYGPRHSDDNSKSEQGPAMDSTDLWRSRA
ncbi:hypothetical protein E4T56_gene19569 [Termitomyces sp. T112]|nr:hypothetical protein E4T56_gene19569 [Termitomyces sp. T112]